MAEWDEVLPDCFEIIFCYGDRFQWLRKMFSKQKWWGITGQLEEQGQAGTYDGTSWPVECCRTLGLKSDPEVTGHNPIMRQFPACSLCTPPSLWVGSHYVSLKTSGSWRKEGNFSIWMVKAEWKEARCEPGWWTSRWARCACGMAECWLVVLGVQLGDLIIVGIGNWCPGSGIQGPMSGQQRSYTWREWDHVSKLLRKETLLWLLRFKPPPDHIPEKGYLPVEARSELRSWGGSV